ncbi:MAG: phytanoyl-CoA dioxygenase family protein, partial [Acidobacteriaceae bacterium]|nr:phytanoyl-CoA dioxygenase family protein [Acidobacteriaceae bacterium]
MIHDLSVEHQPVTSLFPADRSKAKYELHPRQIEFFHEQGYLSGVRILSEEQVDALREELSGLLNASAEQRGLFYEYNSNESTDPSHV